jgi:hypothetical protein
VQAVIWHSFYLAASWRLAAPALAVAWAVTVMAYLRRRWRWPGSRAAPHPAGQLGRRNPVPVAELYQLLLFDRVRENPRRLFGFVRVSQAAQRVNHPLPVKCHGHHQAFRCGLLIRA